VATGYALRFGARTGGEVSLTTGVGTMKAETNTLSVLFDTPKSLILEYFTNKSFNLKDLAGFSSQPHDSKRPGGGGVSVLTG